MALRLIAGKSGQGKTESMLREIVDQSCRHSEKNYFLVVPEQFSLEMQRRMVELHPKKGFFNIDVVSFHRLAYRIFDEAGYVPAEILEDLGVAMILRRILSRKEDELAYFKRSVRKAGFIDEMKSALMEMVSYGVSWKDLEETAGKLGDRPVLQSKCRELALVFSEFEQEISGRYMVTEQILTLASDYVSSSGLTRDNEFYFDGFTGFTPVQLEFLGELLSVAANVHVTVTIPARDGAQAEELMSDEEELFSFSRKFIGSLLALCRERKADLLPVTVLNHRPAPRFKDNPELYFLEEYAFRIRKKAWEDVPSHLHIMACHRQDDEVDFALRQVEYLVRKKGIRYRDCALLCGDVAEYETAFRRKADLLKLPVFVDSKKRLSYHSGVEALRALLHLAEKDYSYESVFRYLKAGMSDFLDEETDFLENYVLSAGVRGRSMWSKPFERRLAGKSQETLARLEALRLRLMEETGDFVKACSGKRVTVRARMEAIFMAMDRLDFPGKLERMARQAEETGDHIRAGEHRRLFQLLLDLLDKIVMIFGEEIMSLKEVSEILDAGLESLGLGLAPLTMDQLVLGDLKRTRLTDIKVLFILGMNDGKIPPVLEDGGLLKDEDKELLREYGLSLSAGLLERSMEDEFYMYMAFSRPSEDLYFSYSAIGRGNDQLRPSPLIGTCKGLFPKLEEQAYPADTGSWYFGIDDSRQLLIEGLGRIRKKKPAWLEQAEGEDMAEPDRKDRVFLMLARYWMEEAACQEEYAAYLDKLNLKKRTRYVSPALVEELYGKELYSSVSRLETFSACPFSYLCNYGLELRDREEFVLQDTDFGNLFHTALRYFSDQVKRSGYRWKELPEEDRARFLEEAMKLAMEENKVEAFGGSARNEYQISRVHRILDRTVRAIQLQLKNSAFEPDRFESSFGFRGQGGSTSFVLEDGRQLTLHGIIDRVDLCQEDKEVLLRIVDYKSGDRNVNLEDIYFGLQLQLMLYLEAAVDIYGRETGKEVVPAGIFYYRFQDPLYRADRFDEDKYWQSFRMKGYANSSQDILDKLEEGYKGLYSMAVDRKKGDGSPTARSQVMTTEDFRDMRHHVVATARKLAERIYSGEMAPEPYQKANKTDGCRYCRYLSVCGFGEGLFKDYYRRLQSFTSEEVLEKIREEEE